MQASNASLILSLAILGGLGACAVPPPVEVPADAVLVAAVSVEFVS